jgi:hypothetical protein
MADPADAEPTNDGGADGGVDGGVDGGLVCFKAQAIYLFDLVSEID